MLEKCGWGRDGKARLDKYEGFESAQACFQSAWVSFSLSDPQVRRGFRLRSLPRLPWSQCRLIDVFCSLGREWMKNMWALEPGEELLDYVSRVQSQGSPGKESVTQVLSR